MKQAKFLLAAIMSFALASCSALDETTSTDSASSSTSSSETGDYTIDTNFALCGNNLQTSTTLSLLAESGTVVPSVLSRYMEEGCYFTYNNWEDNVSNIGYLNVFEDDAGAIYLDSTSTTVTIGGTLGVSGTVFGIEASALTWSSSDTTIATVTAGVVTGAAEGEATITASYTSGETTHSKAIEVTVSGTSDGSDTGATANIVTGSYGCYEFTLDSSSSAVLGEFHGADAYYDEYYTPALLSQEIGTTIKEAFTTNGVGSDQYGDFYLNNPTYNTADQSEELTTLMKILGIYSIASQIEGLTINYCLLNVGSRSTNLTFTFYGSYNGGYNGFQIITTLSNQGRVSYDPISEFFA